MNQFFRIFSLEIKSQFKYSCVDQILKDHLGIFNLCPIRRGTVLKFSLKIMNQQMIADILMVTTETVMSSEKGFSSPIKMLNGLVIA